MKPYIGKTESHILDNGKIYEILSVEQGLPYDR